MRVPLPEQMPPQVLGSGGRGGAGCSGQRRGVQRAPVRVRRGPRAPRAGGRRGRGSWAEGSASGGRCIQVNLPQTCWPCMCSSPSRAQLLRERRGVAHYSLGSLHPSRSQMGKPGEAFLRFCCAPAPLSVSSPAWPRLIFKHLGGHCSEPRSQMRVGAGRGEVTAGRRVSVGGAGQASAMSLNSKIRVKLCQLEEGLMSLGEDNGIRRPLRVGCPLGPWCVAGPVWPCGPWGLESKRKLGQAQMAGSLTFC